MHDTLDARDTFWPAEESRREVMTLSPSSSTTTYCTKFFWLRFVAAMHACLGNIHPNPL